MNKYYVNNNEQLNGDYEVHKEGCSYMPTDNYTYLGMFSNCCDAVEKAKDYHRQVDGCYHCLNKCHTS